MSRNKRQFIVPSVATAVILGLLLGGLFMSRGEDRPAVPGAARPPAASPASPWAPVPEYAAAPLEAHGTEPSPALSGGPASGPGETAVGPAERLRLIRQAGRSRDASCRDSVVEALKDENALLRGEAAEALGLIGGAGAVGILCEVLADADPTVRQRAALALGLLGRREAAPGLIAALEANRDRPDGYGPVICREIVRSLGRLEDRRAVDALIAEMGRQRDLSYLNDVVRSLGSIGDPRAAGIIGEHLAWLEGHKPDEPIARFPWQEAVDAAREALRLLTKDPIREGL